MYCATQVASSASCLIVLIALPQFSLLLPPPLFGQALPDQMQRLPQSCGSFWIHHAGAGERLPRPLLLLLWVWAAVAARRRVCAEGRAAALPQRLWEGERNAQRHQPCTHWVRWERRDHTVLLSRVKRMILNMRREDLFITLRPITSSQASEATETQPSVDKWISNPVSWFLISNQKTCVAGESPHWFRSSTSKETKC